MACYSKHWESETDCRVDLGRMTTFVIVILAQSSSLMPIQILLVVLYRKIIWGHFGTFVCVIGSLCNLRALVLHRLEQVTSNLIYSINPNIRTLQHSRPRSAGPFQRQRSGYLSTIQAEQMVVCWTLQGSKKSMMRNKGMQYANP